MHNYAGEKDITYRHKWGDKKSCKKGEILLADAEIWPRTALAGLTAGQLCAGQLTDWRREARRPIQQIHQPRFQLTSNLGGCHNLQLQIFCQGISADL